MNKYCEQIKADLKLKNPLYIKVRISSKSPKNEVYDQMEDGTYKIRISAQPVRGQANAELIKFLKKELKASEVSIVSGGRDKVK